MLLEISTAIGLAAIGYFELMGNKQEMGTSKLGKNLGIYEGTQGIMASKKHCIKTKKVFENILSIAPPGEGKTTSIIINNLLSNKLPKASKIIFDPKGDIQDAVAKYRESLGEINIFYEPLGDKERYNPLDFTEEFTDFRDLAYILLSNASKGLKDETWVNMSMPLLTAMLLYANYCGEDKNTIEFALDTLIKTDEADLLLLLAETKSDVIAEQYARYCKAKKCGDTDGSIQSTVAMSTALFSDPKIKQNTSESTFNFKDLRDKNKVINIFIKYDIDKSTYLSSLLAVFFSQMVHQLIKNYKKNKSQKVFIFADELQNLGKIPNLKEYLAYMRFAETGMVACIQTVSALYDIYGKYAADSILGCFKTKVIFPANSDPAMLDMFSKLSGESEINIEQNQRMQKTKKVLFTGDEIRRLPDYHVLIICGNQYYLMDKADYYKNNKEYIKNQEAK